MSELFFHRTRTIALLSLGTLLAGTQVGCQMGPGTLPVSSAHYSDAVRVAESEQILVNLVRLRYYDQPIFLEVSSISTQFEFGASGSINGNIVESGPDSLGLGGGIDYAERPTISFGIMGGDEFERDLLEPVSINTIALVAESGWRVDRVLRLAVESLNGLKHSSTASGPTPSSAPVYKDFLEAVSLLQSLASSGQIQFEFELGEETFSDPIARSQLSGEDLLTAAEKGIEFKRIDDDGNVLPVIEERHLVLRVRRNAEGSPQIARLRELLALDPALSRYEVVSRDDAEVDTFDERSNLSQIIVDTRSVQGILYFLSHGVRPPQSDLERGVVTNTVAADGTPFDWDDLLSGLIKVQHSDGRPRNAAIATRHRGKWFYVADDDRSSKATLLLLQHLFTLQSGERPSIKPVLTLPVGG